MENEKKKVRYYLKWLARQKKNEVINLTTHKTFDAFKHYLQKKQNLSMPCLHSTKLAQHQLLKRVFIKPHLTTLQIKQLHILTKKMSSPEDAKLLKQYTPETLDDCKWVSLQKIDYLDPKGKQREWEMTTRKTRSSGTKTDSDSVDGVGIIALLKHPNEPTKIVLQKQFRPPVGGVCIEMPAGLIDPKESVETTAIRELKEETGYSGKIVDKSPIIFNDPGFTNTNLCMVTIEVDMTLSENQHPVSQLEDGEFIQTFSVELDKFHDEMNSLFEKGYKLDARVQNIAQGLQLAKLYKDMK